jgi:hypothetical protein
MDDYADEILALVEEQDDRTLSPAPVDQPRDRRLWVHRLLQFDWL